MPKNKKRFVFGSTLIKSLYICKYSQNSADTCPIRNASVKDDYAYLRPARCRNATNDSFVTVYIMSKRDETIGKIHQSRTNCAIISDIKKSKHALENHFPCTETSTSSVKHPSLWFRSSISQYDEFVIHQDTIIFRTTYLNKWHY